MRLELGFEVFSFEMNWIEARAELPTRRKIAGREIEAARQAVVVGRPSRGAVQSFTVMLFSTARTPVTLMAAVSALSFSSSVETYPLN